ncbi:hypothetical protein [Fructilactobacillus fructivorans]|uniref:Cysteine desulfurase n=1 Tax=Fructilactobacillus fructivorans TaxID=1614 RepID=A0A0C1PMZ7_9LACO|nr:hypothetical protein [Fructilactobacillus fructivorans]KID41291.1 hypothetical protein LfDm3_1136 [Fructilactobacillus fructivorans]MCT0152107.1 hypothetical protein [Fructilactobacillus fructivorans]MCT2867810.1 hypothetical protein [Fructilactobacillus fructivorans]MCT2868386.1 hypothetical protein [Fructilactobacillus fructivorans]MCT2873851.1 hypothetical protein [Fructilactobacillus fructivorans]
MAFSKSLQLKGGDTKYELSPEIKKYTLLDLGFSNTKSGNFAYKKSIDPESPFSKNAMKLKITINSDMAEFKMAIVDGNEMNDVDIFSNDKHLEERDQFNFIMQNMILRKVFRRV